MKKDEEMQEEFKRKLRDILIERYDVDIDEANMSMSTQNYAFIFPGQPFMIRVSTAPKKTRTEILSELMWLDDLKQFKETVCEPNVSKLGNLLEEFEIDESRLKKLTGDNVWNFKFVEVVKEKLEKAEVKEKAQPKIEEPIPVPTDPVLKPEVVEKPVKKRTSKKKKESE